MYLVELKPGREELYRTGDDLALAIRDGDVDARSRIYHRATAKWISITLHPQYRAIIADQKPEPVKGARKAWGLLSSAMGSVPVELPASGAPASSYAIRQRWKRPIGLGLACILLLLGIQLAFTGPRPPWAGQGKPIARTAPQRKSPLNVPLAASPVLDYAGRGNPEDYRLDRVSLASTHIPWPVRATVAGDTIAVDTSAVDTSAVDTSAVDTSAVAIPTVEAAPALPRAPRLRPKALHAALAASAPRAPVKGRPLHSLMARYDAASNGAYARLESGIRAARLNRLFAPGRLTPGGGVPATRLSLAGAANFIRVYRQQQAAIDQAYQDSVGLLAKLNGWKPKDIKQWTSRPPRKESPTLQLLTSSLLASIDSILGVLDEQAGAYKIRGSAIAFENPAATQAYAALRRRIKEGIDGAVGAGGATSFGPAGLLLQAIGTSTLPRET